MAETLPDERPQQRREYTGPGFTFGIAALVVAVVGFGIWFLEIRGDGGGVEAEAGMGVVALAGSLNPTGEAPAAEVGRAAPAFRLRDLDGSAAELTDFRGQYVLLNFWASWCGPCRGETPALQAFFEDRSPGLVVVGVNQQETAETAGAFTEQFDVTYPIVLDADGQVSGAYRVSTGLPVSFLIDPEGVIQRVHLGALTDSDLAELAAELP
ncbi:MAG: redoxin domain-containing protein [Dehalococcoidia bacterium]|nr:redoxin domain-containing protein [Dehalococcoidia bacterium]